MTHPAQHPRAPSCFFAPIDSGFQTIPPFAVAYLFCVVIFSFYLPITLIPWALFLAVLKISIPLLALSFFSAVADFLVLL